MIPFIRLLLTVIWLLLKIIAKRYLFASVALNIVETFFLNSNTIDSDKMFANSENQTRKNYLFTIVVPCLVIGYFGYSEIFFNHSKTVRAKL